MRIPAEVSPLLTTLPEAFASILGGNLVGLYVYGSVLAPEFDSTRSDVDCIAVMERPLDDTEFSRLDDWLADAGKLDQWVTRMQMSFLIQETVRSEDSHACLFQFGELRRTGSDGNPIIWMDCCQRGGTLWGAAPESFVTEITPEMFHKAMVREVGYLREGLCVEKDCMWRDKLSYRVYAVLTLCRILYSAHTGKLASKTSAGRWALDHVHNDWRELVHQGLDGDEAGGLERLPISTVCAFVDYTRATVG
jgi:hypothetical protein